MTSSFDALLLSVSSGRIGEAVRILDSDPSLFRATDSSGNSLLHIAAQSSRSPELCSELIRRGLSVEERSAGGLTPLHCAAKAGDLTVTRALLDQHHAALDAVSVLTYDPRQIKETLRDPYLLREAEWLARRKELNSLVIGLVAESELPDVDRVTDLLLSRHRACLPTLIECGDNALHFAAEFGKNAELVGELIHRGLSVESRGRLGRTPLLKAARSGDLDTARYLLDHQQASLMVIDDNQCSALHLAARFGRNPALLTELIGRGLPVESRAVLATTPLLLAVASNHIASVRTLLETHGASLTAVHEYKDNALHVAANRRRNPALVSYLIERGLPVDSRGYHGATAFHYAASSGDFETVRMLLTRFAADLTAVDDGKANALHRAAASGRNPALVGYLIERGLPVDSRNGKGGTPLHCASSSGDLETVQMLLCHYSADLTLVDDDGDNALHHASLFGRNPELVGYLIERGIPVNSRGSLGKTALHYAASAGDLPTVKALLCQYGADLTAVNDEKDTVLHRAAWGGRNPSLVSFFIERGLSVETLGFKRRTPLLQAAPAGDLETARTLLDRHGASLTAIDEDKCNALHLVCKFGKDPLLATELINRGLSVESVGFAGRTPLLQAVTGLDLETVRVLLAQHGASLSATDINDDNALHCAMQQSANLPLITELIERGLSVESPGFRGETPLFAAVRVGSSEAIKHLIDRHGACLTAKCRNGQTALHLAAELGKTRAIADLLNLGLSVESRGHHGRTPLLVAACAGQLQTVQCLLDQHGADLTATADDRMNGLHVAAGQGHLAIVQELLDRGISIESRGTFGRRPLHYAAWGGRLQTVLYLLDRGADVTALDAGDLNTLHFAAVSGNAELAAEIIARLTARGAPLQPRSHYRSGFEVAIFNGDVEMVQLLLNHGVYPKGNNNAVAFNTDLVLPHLANPSTTNDTNTSVSKEQKLLILRELLKLNIASSSLVLGLTEACRHNNVEFARLLLEYPKTPLQRTTHGSALEIACALASLDMVLLLLSHGVDPSSHTHFGNTPLLSARAGAVTLNPYTAHESRDWTEFMINITARHPILIVNRHLPELRHFDWSDCDHLIAISINNAGLNILPPQLQHLPNLVALNVDRNNLTSLPAWLKNCRSLVSLTARINQITLADDLPPSLRTLQLGNNRLSRIPPSVSEMKELRVLGLSNNDINFLPRFLIGPHLPFLSHLGAQSNGLGDQINIRAAASNASLLSHLRGLVDILRQKRVLVEDVLIPDLASIVIENLETEHFEDEAE